MNLVVQNMGELENFFRPLLSSNAALAIDTETTGRKPAAGDFACGYSFAYRVSDSEIASCYIPIRHKPFKKEGSLFTFSAKVWKNLDPEGVNNFLRPILQAKLRKLILHHAKFDIQVLWREGINLPDRNGEELILHDTMLISNLTDPRRPNGLKKLMDILLGETHTEQQEVFRYMKYHGISKEEGYEKLDIQIAGLYAARDTDGTLKIFEKLWPTIEDIWDIYVIEQRIIKVIARMEWRGMPADKAFLADTAERLRRSAQNVAARAYKIVGREFDLDSPGDVATLLFGELRIPFPKGAKGLTDKTALEKIEHPVARLITSYRQLSKLAGTYMGPMSEMVTSAGRIHPSFQQVRQDREGVGGREEGGTGTETGRLSCTEPNLQNVSSRRKVYKKGVAKVVNQTLVRRAFRIHDPNQQFLLFDYSQMELRLLAHASGDPIMVGAYEKTPNEDLHETTARKIFPNYDTLPEKERKQLRTIGKTINFGIVYGMGADRLAVELELVTKHGIERGIAMAREFLEIYFDTYPGVKELDQQLKHDFKRAGFVQTLYGRKRPLEMAEEYKALNTLIQGSCADMNKIALFQVEMALMKHKSKPINNIHDEITILHHIEEEDVVEIVTQAMQDFPGIKVPIVVEASRATPTWAHKLEIKHKAV
jgi:DNA polymerase-1